MMCSSAGCPPSGPTSMSHSSESHPAGRRSLPPHVGSNLRSSICDIHGRLISESLVRLPTAHVAPDHSSFNQFSTWTPFVSHPPSLARVFRDSRPQSAQTNELQQAHAPSPAPTVPDFSSLLSPLNSLQANMSGMQMDVQNVLKELRTIKTTQKNLVDRVDSLEEVLGVSHEKAGQKQVRGRPSKGNVKDKATDEVGALEEGNQTSQTPVANLVDRLGAIEVAVEKLLDRMESRSCERCASDLVLLPSFV
ncbi:hypothetical protein F5J12DRAFT_813170 [Pisolithus orientalis]|uniref:uncharacterized protein n=1 Tax=Pisolithus orientalis TaxID=936130 RepID=UPI002223FF51|nr:uncharacterized protein F5J12DRAFT_813170 [Pisolithus orientalis]KAI6019785.1 hypothetical protein F5J12DRAFT_813170 [Pisolithus orientalis]